MRMPNTNELWQLWHVPTFQRSPKQVDARALGHQDAEIASPGPR